VKPGSGWEHLLEIARIEGLDRAYTWNPAVGCHGEGCEVHKREKCWAEKIAKRFGWDFNPHLVEAKLYEPMKMHKAAVITPVSMGDLFGQKTQDIERILAVMGSCWWHVFAVLTKLPQHALQFNPYLENVWFGVTVNSQAGVWRLDLLRKIEAPKKYCLFEPLYGPISYPLDFLDLIVIGPQNYPTVQPKKEWVDSIVKNAGSTPIFYKSKLRGMIGKLEKEDISGG